MIFRIFLQEQKLVSLLAEMNTFILIFFRSSDMILGALSEIIKSLSMYRYFLSLRDGGNQFLKENSG